MQDRILIRILIISAIVAVVLYKLRVHSWPSLSILNSDSCTKSLLESNDFICESDSIWNERKILHRIQDELNMKKPSSTPYFLNNWEPDFHCSHARRIGIMGDGGKWVCDLFRLQNRSNCSVYSAGSNGDFTFETDMKKYASNCDIHTFDFGNYTCSNNICTYHQFWLGDGKNPSHSKTWPMMLKELGHENRLIDVLKIDVEGGEFSYFPTIFQAPAISHPRQILVEIHPKTDAETHGFFELLRANHYVIFSKEPNLLMKGELYEYCFLKLNPEFFK